MANDVVVVVVVVDGTNDGIDRVEFVGDNVGTLEGSSVRTNDGAKLGTDVVGIPVTAAVGANDAVAVGEDVRRRGTLGGCVRFCIVSNATCPIVG